MIRTLVAVVATLVVSVTVTLAADWPQWRGPERDGISKDTGLLKEWPKAGPALRWKATDLGTGYSTPAVAKGRVYVQTTRGKEEYALALDEKTGKQVWSTAIGKVGKNQGMDYPGTRSTTTIDGDRVYCLASDGELVCLSTEGSIKWQKHLRKDFAGKPGAWVYSESVLIDGDALVCTPGGPEASLAALNKITGETIWKSPLPDLGNAEYSSVMIAEADGVKQYVQFLRKGVAGVDAKTGKLLWQYAKTVDFGANILTPVVQGNKVFTSGSRSGGALLELARDGEGVKAKEVYFNKSLGSSIGGAVLVDGYLYGSAGQGVYCAEFATGKVKWNNRSVGPSSICYADGRLYVRGYNNWEVALVEATPEEYREKGRFKQPDRSKVQCWPHPIVANGGLYLRDQDVLLCYEVGEKAGK